MTTYSGLESYSHRIRILQRLDTVIFSRAVALSKMANFADRRGSIKHGSCRAVCFNYNGEIKHVCATPVFLWEY